MKNQANILTRLKNGIKNKDLHITSLSITSTPNHRVIQSSTYGPVVIEATPSSNLNLDISSVTPRGVEILGNLLNPKSPKHE